MSLAWGGHLWSTLFQGTYFKGELKRSYEVWLCGYYGILQHYLRFLNLDLSVSIVESIFSTQKGVKERRNGVANVEISTKQLYLGEKKTKTEKIRRKGELEKVSSIKISHALCVLVFFCNFSQARATCSPHSPSLLTKPKSLPLSLLYNSSSHYYCYYYFTTLF